MYIASAAAFVAGSKLESQSGETGAPGICQSDSSMDGEMGAAATKVMRVCVESRHPYAPNTHLAVRVRVPRAAGLRITLDSRCDSKRDRDKLVLYTDHMLKKHVGTFHGPSGSGNWAPPLDIKTNSVVVIFETDSSPGEWGFRLYIQPLDENGQATVVSTMIFDSVPAYTQGLRGKLDVTLQPDETDGSDNVMLINFDHDGCSLTPTQHASRGSAPSSSEGGRLKLISSRGKHVYVAGSRWEPVHLHGLNRFTLDCKGPPTGRLEYRLSASLRACDPFDLRAG